MPIRDGEWRHTKGFLAATAIALALCLASAAAASAGPPWLDPADLSLPGRNASNPVVAMDAAGGTVAIWERQSTTGPSYNLQFATRSPGGSFTAPADLALNSTEPRLAMTPSGEAVAVWKHFENPPGAYTIQAATRPPGGGFSPPQTIYAAAPTVIPQGLQVAIGAGGDAVVTWNQVDPSAEFGELVCGENPEYMTPIHCSNPSFVQGSYRPAGGAFGEATRISAPRGAKASGETEGEQEEREIAESMNVARAARPAVDGGGNATVVLTYFDGADTVVQAVSHPAGGEFGSPVQVSTSGEDAAAPDIGVDPAGDAIASWVRAEGPAEIVQAAEKGPGGPFSPLPDLSPAGETAGRPLVGVGADGSAAVSWRLEAPGGSVLQVSSRGPGGAFSPAVDVSNGEDSPLFDEMAVGDGGATVVAWSGANGADQITRAAVRAPGSGAFAAPVAISQSSAGFFHPQAASDAGGDATVVWVRDDGTHDIVQFAGYDAQPPRLEIGVPATGTVGGPVEMTATSSDAWPLTQPSFDFGDGAHADGAAVSHAYAAPGTYTVGAGVTDAGGRTVTRTATVLVKARNEFRIRKLKLNRRKGTATLTVIVPEPGSLKATGRGVRKARAATATGGSLKLRLRASRKGLKRLRTKGKLKARLRIAYSPVGGDTSVRHRKVTLRLSTLHRRSSRRHTRRASGH